MGRTFRLAVIMAAAIVAACSSAEEKKAAIIKSTEAQKAECRRVFSDPSLARVRARAPLGFLEERIAASSTSSATIVAEDKPAIEAWVKAREDCWAAGESWRSLETAVFIDVFSAAVFVENGLIAKLYLGQLSWGEFSAWRIRLTDAERSTIFQLETAGLRVRQEQLAQQFINDCNAQIKQGAMSEALQQMRAQMNDPGRCHSAGKAACT